MKRILGLAAVLALAAPAAAHAQYYNGYSVQADMGAYGDTGYGAQVQGGMGHRGGDDDGYQGGGGYYDSGPRGGGYDGRDQDSYYGGGYRDRDDRYTCQAVGCTQWGGNQQHWPQPCHQGCGHDQPRHWNDGGSWTSPDGRHHRSWRSSGSYSSSARASSSASAYGSAYGGAYYGSGGRPCYGSC